MARQSSYPAPDGRHIMRRRDLAGLFGGVVLATMPLVAGAQQRTQLPRIGFLGNSTTALEATPRRKKFQTPARLRIPAPHWARFIGMSDRRFHRRRDLLVIGRKTAPADCYGRD